MRLRYLTVTAGLGISMLAGCSDDSENQAEAAEVNVSTCLADPAGGQPKAEGTIVNSSSKPSGYTFRVRFLDPSGNEVSQAANAVANVAPGETATWQADGSTSARGPLRCEVANVTRTAVGA